MLKRAIVNATRSRLRANVATARATSTAVNSAAPMNVQVQERVARHIEIPDAKHFPQDSYQCEKLRRDAHDHEAPGSDQSRPACSLAATGGLLRYTFGNDLGASSLPSRYGGVSWQSSDGPSSLRRMPVSDLL